MKKEVPISINELLLGWFFLDMTGVYIGDKYLVTTSYAEDGIFFLIFLISFVLFIVKEKVGKYVLTVWLGCWFLTQFFSHWYYTIVGNAENKISYFANTIKLFNDNIRYIPDLYHIILHLLIIASFVLTAIYCRQSRRK